MDFQNVPVGITPTSMSQENKACFDFDQHKTEKSK